MQRRSYSLFIYLSIPQFNPYNVNFIFLSLPGQNESNHGCEKEKNVQRAGLNFQYSRRIVVIWIPSFEWYIVFSRMFTCTAMTGNKTETCLYKNYLKHKIIGREKRITERENSIST